MYINFVDVIVNLNDFPAICNGYEMIGYSLGNFPTSSMIRKDKRNVLRRAQKEFLQILVIRNDSKRLAKLLK